jgi:hypothetical protein
LQVVELQPAALEVGKRVIVERASKDKSVELNECAATRRSASEGDCGLDFERPVVTGEVQVHVVVIDRDEPGSLARLGARQVVMRSAFR